MKTKHILTLCVPFLTMNLFFACNKDEDENPVLNGGVSDIAYVFIPKADYSGYVQVFGKNGSVSAYPGDGDVGSRTNSWKKLEGEYYQASWLYVGGMFLDVTFTEYHDIWQLYYTDEYKHKNILDTLNTRILEEEPYLEIYQYKKMLVTRDLDTLNSLIESGEFFTYEGVTRIK